MPNLRIYIEDLSGNQVAGTEALNVIDYATGLSYGSAAPKGHVECKFRLKRRDIYTGFEVRESYGVIVQDGLRVIWQGRLEDMTRTTSGGDEFLDCRAVGWYVALSERVIRKRWVDLSPVVHLYWPASLLRDNIQNSWVTNKRDNWLQIFAGTKDIDRAGDTYIEHYTPWANVKNIYIAYRYRSGEGFNLDILDVDGTTTDHTENLVDAINGANGVSGDFTHAMTVNTEVLGIQLRDTTDTYDQNDWIILSSLIIRAKYHTSHSAVGSELYNVSELVEDVLWLVDDLGTVISADLDDIATVATVLNGFTVEEFTPAAAVIDTIIAHSDSTNKTYIPYVWDREGTSDGLPKFELGTWSIADYDFVVDIDSKSVKSASAQKDGRMLYNWIAVQYVDDQGRAQTRTPDDNANLKDTTSIAAEYPRMKPLKVGKGTATDADNIGEGFLQWHKDRKWRGSITVIGDVKTKAGNTMPVEWLRAGMRYYCPQLDEIFFARTVNINAETREATITPDLPPDETNVIIDRLRTQALEAAREAKYNGAG